MAFPTIDLDTVIATEAEAKEALIVLDSYRAYALELAQRRHFTERGMPVPASADIRLSDAASRIPDTHRW